MKKWKISNGKVVQCNNQTKTVVGVVKKKLLTHGHYQIEDTDGNVYLVKRKGVAPLTYVVEHNGNQILVANVAFDINYGIRPSSAVSATCQVDNSNISIVHCQNKYQLFVNDQLCGRIDAGRLAHTDVVQIEAELPDWLILCLYVFVKLMLHEDDLYVA